MNIVMTGLERLVSLAGKRAVRISTHSGTADKGDIFVSLPRAVPVGPEGPDYSGAETYLADALRAGVRAVVCTPAVLKAAQAALAQDAAKTACDAVAGEVAAAVVLPPSVSPEAGHPLTQASGNCAIWLGDKS